MKRIAGILSFVVVASTLAVAQPASATDGDPSAELYMDGSLAAGVLPGDIVTSSLKAPVTSTGSTPVQLTSVWNNEAATIADESDITAPHGWTVEYTTDGDSWNDSLPDDPSTVLGVRTSGTVVSDGYSDGLQHYSVTGTPDAVGLGSFSGSSGGDGWDVFFGSGNVFNIYHHYDYIGVDCHSRTTGDPCWTEAENDHSGSASSARFFEGYASPARSTGFVDESASRVWALALEISTEEAGFLCVDVSDVEPEVCSGVGVGGFVALGSSSLGGGWWKGWMLTDVAEYHSGSSTKLYTKTADANSLLLCLDVDAAAPCAEQPYSPSDGYTSPGGGWTNSRLKAFGNKIYISSADSQFDCFDVTTNVRCTGTWPQTDVDVPGPIFAVTSGGGAVVEKVCTQKSTCFGPDGSSQTYPSDIPEALTNSAGWPEDDWGDNYNLGDRYYFQSQTQEDTYDCYDFATMEACAGFTGSVLGGYVYALRVDPEDSNCLWSNSNQGAIIPFNATTGEIGCVPDDATVELTADVFVPQLQCASDDRAVAWDEIILDLPEGVNAEDARLTVLDGEGEAVSGWSDKEPVDGAFDLAALTVADTGTEPTFRIVFAGYTADNLDGIEGTLHYSGGAPELCIDLTAQAVCPSGNGQVESDVVTGTPIEVDSTIVFFDGTDDETSTPLISSATADEHTDCFGTISGTLRQDLTDDPVAGVKIRVVYEDGGGVAEATSDSGGDYEIPRLYPGVYVVLFGPTATMAPVEPVGVGEVVGGEITDIDGVYRSSALRAPDVLRRVAPNTSAVFTLTPTGGTGSLEDATVLIDPSSGEPESSLAIVTQPMWTVTTLTSVTATAFDIEDTFYAVYQVETTGGDVAQGLLTLIVGEDRTTGAGRGGGGTTPPAVTPPPSPAPQPEPTPSGGLPNLDPGQSQAYENGQPVSVIVSEIEPGAWEMTGPDFAWQMVIPAADTPGSDQGEVLLIRSRDVELSGYGFLSGTFVDVWLLPPSSATPLSTGVGGARTWSGTAPLYLGQLPVGGDGRFQGPLPIPDGIATGHYTVQADGTSFDGRGRTLNLGVRVVDAKVTLPITGSESTPIAMVAWWLLVLGLGTAFFFRRRGMTVS